MPNAEFSHIIVDKGILDDHMPDSVQVAVECLYQQLFGAKATRSHTTLDTNSNKTDSSVQYHCNGTEANGVGEVCIVGSELDNRNTVEANGGRIKAPEENGITEAIVHVSLEDKKNSLADQETFV